MSSVKITGNASGTGVLTIAAPNTNSNYTLTLPAATGNILTSATTTGFPAGSVIQVVQGTATSQVSTTSTTYADTNLSASITPTSSTSKILVIVNQGLVIVGGAAVGYGYQVNAGLQILRGSTIILAPKSDSGGKYTAGVSTGAAPASGVIGLFTIATLTYLDSPATTSSTTYKTQFAKGTSGMDTIYATDGAGTSTITLIEVAA